MLFIKLLGQPGEVLFQLLLTDFLHFGLLPGGEFLPHRFIHLDDAQRPGVAEHLHILEPLEGIGQDVPLGLLVGVSASGKQTVGLFHHQSGSPASLIVGAEVSHDVRQLDAALFVGVAENRLDEHRLVGVVHIHLAHHLQEEFLAVGIVDEGPAVLSSVALQRFLFEILEGPVLTHGHHQVGHQLAFPHIPLDGLGLHIHPADKLHGIWSVNPLLVSGRSL